MLIERRTIITNYQTILTQVETWLQSMREPVVDLEHITLDENATIGTLEQNKETLKTLMDREKTLNEMADKCKELQQHANVGPLASQLLNQLTITIQILHEHILLYTTRIDVLEQHLRRIREQPTSLQSECTIDSSPMPEEEVPGRIDVEQQTSFPLQVAAPVVVDTLDISVQTTKERKPTENIVVTQTITGDHETIRFESATNPTAPEKVEDVFVDAKYKVPGDATRTSELVLRNVPQAFETTFVEPDETTTEVVVDPDGTKRIIVRKLTRTRQQVVQQHQQFTTISTLVDGNSVPITQSVTQVNVANQQATTTMSGAGGSTTTVMRHASGSLAVGSAPDNLIIQETFETEPELEQFENPADDVKLQGVTMHEGDVAYVDRHNINRLPTPEPLAAEPGFEQSSIRAVVQQVTRRIIRRTRKIIKRIVIIDGKEHITEEVVEEPEEIEISEEEVPNINVNIQHMRDGQIITRETLTEPVIVQTQTTPVVPAPTVIEEQVVVTASNVVIPAPSTIEVQENVTQQQSTDDVHIQESRPTDSVATDERIVIEECVSRQEIDTDVHEQKPTEQEQIQETNSDVQVLEFVSAPVEVVDSAPTVNVTHIELAEANVNDVPQEHIESEIVEQTPQPEFTNITNIWPQEHHLVPLEIEISSKPETPEEINVDSQQVPADDSLAKDLWPTDPRTGSPFQLEEYQFEATIQPTEVTIDHTVVTEIEQPNVQITIQSPEAKSTVSAADDEVKPQIEPSPIEEAAAPTTTTTQANIKPTIDIRSATQMFINHELNTSDATTRTIRVTLPSQGTQSPGSISVTMKAEPDEPTKVNVHLMEESEVVKDKTPTPSIDPSVEQSIELDVDDDNTISEHLEMPEIAVTPVPADDDVIQREQETKISPDESYKSMPELEGAVKIIEESVVSSPSDSPKPIPHELVIATDIIEAKQVEDEAQQTSPTLNLETVGEVVTKHVDVRSAQTSPQTPTAAINVSLQTSPEPQTKTVVDIAETEVQTSPVQVGTPVENVPIETTTDEVQTDDISVPQAEISTQTIIIETKELELQTTPTESPRKEEEIVQSADVVPHVTEAVITKIIRDLPITIPTTHESTNTETITTTDIVTQTIEQSPRGGDNDDLSIATTSSEPYEIHIEASVTIPDDDSSTADADQPRQPVVVEISKTYVMDDTKPGGVEEISTTYQESSGPADKKKKKKNKKKNKNKSVDDGDAIDKTKQFLESEQAHGVPEKIVPPTAPPLETEVIQATEIEQQPIVEVLTTSEQHSPRLVQMDIIQTTEYCEPIVQLCQETPAIQDDTVDAAESIASESSTPVLDDDAVECSTTTTKPQLVQLSLTRTTVYDTLTPIPANIKPSSETSMEKKPKKSKQRATSSVTIEEVMSPTQEADVPLTPGLDTVEQYEQSPESLWSTKLNLNRPATSEPTITTELAELDGTPQPLVQWHHASDAITNRIRNINNVRNIRLSNVLHLATLSEVVTEEPTVNRVQSVNNQMNDLQRAIESRQVVIIQRTVITIIETISVWLETIEYRVYLNRQNSSEGPSEDKVQQLHELNDELTNINDSVKELSAQLDLAGEVVSPTDKTRITSCFDNLKAQVQAVETVTKDNSEQADQVLRRWNEYITIVHTITLRIRNLQQKFDEILEQTETPINAKLQQLDDLENENAVQARDISKVISTARALMRDFPSKQLPQDVHSAYDASRTLDNSITTERGKLLQLLSLADEYEQTLREFEQITVLAETLVNKPINVSSLDELHQEMQKHRKFFINMSHCKFILESLQENLDADSRIKHAELHESLYNRAVNILEKAAERAQKISLAASRWTKMDRDVCKQRQWLQVAQQRGANLSEVTSSDYNGYINLYQSLSDDINSHQPEFLQLIKTATQLQDLINAPHVEEENNDALVVLLKLREEVTLYLRRLHSFRELWTTYVMSTDKLENWIDKTERDLAAIEVPRDLRTQPIENMRQFWEIKAHHKLHINVRNDRANQFEKAIEVLPIVDVALQRQFHGELDSRWYAVSSKIGEIQNAIVNSLSDQELPINDKLILFKRELEEIQLNIISNKTVIKTEDELSLYIERTQVLSGRIAIIDNELGKIGMLPSSEPEQVGELFALSHRINCLVAEELENANNLRDRLNVIQQGIARVQQSQLNNTIVLDACENKEKLGSEQIEAAIVECQDVKDELNDQWQDIMRLRQLLHALPMRLRVSVSPVQLERDLTRLQDKHTELESRCAHILALLKSRLVLWRRFERQLEIVEQSIHETDYMVDILKVNGQVDYKRLRKTTERLEVSSIHNFW